MIDWQNQNPAGSGTTFQTIFRLLVRCYAVSCGLRMAPEIEMVRSECGANFSPRSKQRPDQIKSREDQDISLSRRVQIYSFAQARGLERKRSAFQAIWIVSDWNFQLTFTVVNRSTRVQSHFDCPFLFDYLDVTFELFQNLKFRPNLDLSVHLVLLFKSSLPIWGC